MEKSGNLDRIIEFIQNEINKIINECTILLKNIEEEAQNETPIHDSLKKSVNELVLICSGNPEYFHSESLYRLNTLSGLLNKKNRESRHIIDLMIEILNNVLITPEIVEKYTENRNDSNNGKDHTGYDSIRDTKFNWITFQRMDLLFITEYKTSEYFITSQNSITVNSPNIAINGKELHYYDPFSYTSTGYTMPELVLVIDNKTAIPVDKRGIKILSGSKIDFEITEFRELQNPAIRGRTKIRGRSYIYIEFPK